jgi:hypothetical protein
VGSIKLGAISQPHRGSAKRVDGILPSPMTHRMAPVPNAGSDRTAASLQAVREVPKQVRRVTRRAIAVINRACAGVDGSPITAGETNSMQATGSDRVATEGSHQGWRSMAMMPVLHLPALASLIGSRLIAPSRRSSSSGKRHLVRQFATRFRGLDPESRPSPTALMLGLFDAL